MSKQLVSKQTQKNWWIDAALFSSAVVAALSGIYFLYLPSGGFQGGRNPLYNDRCGYRPPGDPLAVGAQHAAARLERAYRQVLQYELAWTLELDPQHHRSRQFCIDRHQRGVLLVRPRRALGS
jgi:hypothetical protein